MKIRATFFISLVTFALSAFAEPHGAKLSPELIAEDASLQPGGKTWVGVHFMIPEGWHLYWKNPGDSGKAPEIHWITPVGFSVSQVNWPYPERLTTNTITNYGYTDSLLLMSALRAPPNISSEVKLAADVSWLVCKDFCIPGKAKLSFILPVSTATPTKSKFAGLFEATRKRQAQGNLPDNWNPTVTAEDNRTVLTLTTNDPNTFFYPKERYQFDNSNVKITHSGNQVRIELTKSELATEPLKELAGVFVANGRAYEVLLPFTETADTLAILRAILLAFLGGIILNLMPCVFPVLSIKAFSLLQQAHQNKKEVRLHGILYSLGVLVSFWVLAVLLILLRAGGQKLGWGFQLQSPVFDAVLISILFALSLNLVGVFEIEVGSVGSLGSGLASRKGMVGAFFTGVLATLVATPCTAPFMGTALGFAASQPGYVAFLIFTFLAVGLAIPYLLLSFLPNIGKVLPRPGRWMESVKQFMAFPLFGTVIWLLWVVGLQAGLTSVTHVLIGLLLLSVAAWIYRRWRNNLSGAFVTALLAGVIWVGILGASPKTETADLAWQPYSRARVDELRAEGKPIFIDFTAAWCVTCKVNEAMALSSPSIAAKMKELGVVALKGDWTNSDAEITRALSELGRNGVPLYVIYPAQKNSEPRILPQILTSQLVLDELSKVDSSR